MSFRVSRPASSTSTKTAEALGCECGSADRGKNRFAPTLLAVGSDSGVEPNQRVLNAPVYRKSAPIPCASRWFVERKEPNVALGGPVDGYGLRTEQPWWNRCASQPGRRLSRGRYWFVALVLRARRADERHRMGIMVLDSKSSERRSTATLPLTWQDGHERRQRGRARRVLRPRDGGK